jgi:succinate dehydrogenase/fumarate reductase flavoprotein subunit
MKTNKQVTKELSRRDFIRTTAVGVGATALAGVGAGEAKAEGCVPAKWDKEADVVVVGFGGAGATAAIGAHDKGAKVILLEKAPEEHAGGNTGVCCGGMSIPPSLEVGIDHYNTINMGTVTDPEVTRVFVEMLMGLQAKLASVGITATGTGIIRIGANGADGFAAVKSAVNARGIEVLYETPATELIQDPKTKEILGVKVKSEGWDKYIKAKKGVVMSLGGYERDPWLLANHFLPNICAYPWGTPYNTGDGIRMVQHVGAQLWHMTCVEYAPFCIKAPSEIHQCSFTLPTTPYSKAGFMFVNNKGNRFMNEAQSLGHTKEQLAVNHITGELYAIVGWNHKGVGFTNVPFYMVYDKRLQDKGKIWISKPAYGAFATFAEVHNLYQWSADNSAEISKGWIIQADTIAELAAKAGIDAAGLQASVDKYNAYCQAQNDADFRKPAANLVPVDTPPYYLTELAIGLINTQGGPQHDSKMQVVDEAYKPIGRLYAAGEFGSFFGGVYHGANNYPEALASGFIAGENAVDLKPWS